MNTLAPLLFIHLDVGALHRLRQRLAAAVVGRPAHADLHVVGQFGGGRCVADGLLERVDEVLRARLPMETDEGGKLVAAVAAADAADAAAEVGQGVRHNAEGFVALQVAVAVAYLKLSMSMNSRYCVSKSRRRVRFAAIRTKTRRLLMPVRGSTEIMRLRVPM